MAKITQLEWEKLDHARMELAIAEMAKSPNLRFFMRSHLTASGVGITPFAQDDRATSFACGRQSVGHDLIATMLAHNPSLYLTLLEEDQNEQTQRGS